MELRKTLIFTFLFVLNTMHLFSWDEVTHAYMTQMIPKLVKNPELKKLLKENKDEFTYGCWYTDIYQYASSKKDRIEALNPHKLSNHYAAFMPYLQKPDVQNQDNYNRLLSLYLGSLAHLAEDLWYDNNLNPYQKQKSDRMKGDSMHGAFIAKQFGYIGIHVKRYSLYDDLFTIYSEAKLLPDQINSAEKLQLLMEKWSDNQYKKLTALKLLNFVGGNQLYNASPWTAANLENAPGGIRNAAEVAAKLVESTWLQMNKKEVPIIIHSQYMWPIGSMSFMLSSPNAGEELNHYKAFVLAPTGDTINGKFESEWGNELVRVFKPETPFNEGEDYTLIFQNDISNQSLSFPFIAHFDSAMDMKFAAQYPWYKTMGMGLFGFVPICALALLLYGIGGTIRFNWSVRHQDKKMPAGLILSQRLFQFLGFVALVFAFYVLVDKGWLIVDAVL